MTARDALDALAQEHGLQVERRTFDGGQTIFVSAIAGERRQPTLASATSTYDDDIPVDQKVLDALVPVLKDAEAAAFRATQDEVAAQYQALIDAGQWFFEGAIGRSMMGAVEAGDCILGPRAVHDYWGNLIPAYWMVQEGTVGSITYAEETRS